MTTPTAATVGSLQLTYTTAEHTLSHLRANAGTPTPAAVHRGEADGRWAWQGYLHVDPGVVAYDAFRSTASLRKARIERRTCFAVSTSPCSCCAHHRSPRHLSPCSAAEGPHVEIDTLGSEIMLSCCCACMAVLLPRPARLLRSRVQPRGSPPSSAISWPPALVRSTRRSSFGC